MIQKMFFVFLCSFLFVQPMLAQEEKPLLKVVIPSLDQAIQHAGEVIERFVPGMGENLLPMLEQTMPPGFFQNIQKNVPLVILVYPPMGQSNGDAFYVALPLVENADPALVFGGGPEFKKIGAYTVFGEAGTMERIHPDVFQLENLKGDLCVQVQFHETWKKFLNELGTMIPDTQQDPMFPWFGELLKGLFQAVQSVTEQVEHGQFSLYLSGEAVSFDLDVTFISGSPLAQFAQAASTQTTDTFILPTSDAQMVMQIAFPEKEFEQLLKNISNFITQFKMSDETKKLIEQYFSLIGPYYSNGQMSLNFNAETGMQFVYVAKGFSLERYREIMLEMQQMNWAYLFQSSGLEMNMNFSQEYQENIRQNGTVPIHLQIIRFNFEGAMADLQNSIIGKMYGKDGMKLELAEVGPYIVMSSQGYETIMDQVIQKLSSTTVPPADSPKMLSFDLDLIQYYLSIFEVMKDQMPAPFIEGLEKLKELGPQEKFSFEIRPFSQGINHHGRVPLDPIVNVFQLFQAMSTDSAFDTTEVEVEPPVEENEFAHYIGQIAPNFTGKNLQGNVEDSLEAYRGKVVILDFWATWCPPCVKEIPGFIRLQERYKDQGLVVLGVTDESASEIKDFVKQNKINYPILYEYIAETEPYTLVTSIPTTFIIDPEGVIRAVHVGFTSEEQFERDILPYLKK